MNIVRAIDILAQHNIIRTVKVVGDYYRIYCPIHNDGNERKASCGVLIHDQYKNGQHYPAGWFHCFACGYADTFVNTINKIFELRGLGQSGVSWLNEHVPDFEEDEEIDYLVPTDIMEQLINKHSIQDIRSRLDESNKFSIVSEEELSKYRFTVPYMYERKLTDKIIEDYDIGYDANWQFGNKKSPTPCITFPVRDISKNTLFICRRSIEGKIFHYPEGVIKPLYGIDMIPATAKSIIICESCFNALTAVAYGYFAVATLGTGNSYQIQQLKELGIHDFVLCFDGDDAGRRATNKFKKALKSVAFVWTIEMPDGKDLNDCTKEEFDELYKNRV